LSQISEKTDRRTSRSWVSGPEFLTTLDSARQKAAQRAQVTQHSRAFNLTTDFYRTRDSG